MGWFKYEAKCVARLVDQPPLPRPPGMAPTVGLFQNISQDEDDKQGLLGEGRAELAVFRLSQITGCAACAQY